MQMNDHLLLSVLPVKQFGAYREHIGSICIQWSFLELMVERVLAAFDGKGNEVGFEAMVGPNVTRLKEIAETTDMLRDRERKEPLDTLAYIESLYDDRNRIVHGLWGYTDSGEVHSIHVPTNRNKRRKAVFGKAMTLKDLHDFKWKIVTARRCLQPYTFEEEDVITIRDEAAED